MSSNRYKKLGFEQLGKVVDKESVTRFRSIIENYSNSGTDFPLDPEFCLQDEDILEIAFTPRLISELRQKFHPDFVMFPDIEVQYNLIGGLTSRDGKFDGWHVDSGSEGRKKYLTDENYGFAKVGIYFQDNTDMYGGGVDLVPSSHRFVGFGPVRLRFLIKKVVDKFRIIFGANKIRTQAGDALFFDSRVQHRSSRVEEKGKNENNQKFQSNDFVSLPKGKEKIVVYFDIAYPNSCREFWSNAKRRAKSEDPTESRHFKGYTNDNENLSLFKEKAKSTDVKTVLDLVDE